MVDQRNYKSQEEIVEIRRACDVTSDMHIAAMKAICEGKGNMEIVLSKINGQKVNIRN